MGVVADYLRKSGVQYFATVGLDGRPKVRPFQFMIEEAGKLYFATSNRKSVYREIEKRPHVEISACGDGGSWIRLSGKVVFVSDLGIKAKTQEASPLVKSIYKTPENPDFEVFFLDEATATIADFSGEPPKTYRI